MADTENNQTTTPASAEQSVTPDESKKTTVENVVAMPVEEAKQAAEQAKQSAGEVAGQVSEGAQQVAGQVSEGAQQVAGQVTGQLKSGMDQLAKVDIQKMFTPAAGQPAVTKYEKLLGGVSYIPLAPIGTLVLKGDSNFVKLHGRQSLVLTVIFFLCIFLYIVPLIGLWLAGVIQFAVMVLGVYSMYQALIGNWWKIPVLGDIAEMIPVSFFVSVAKEAITGKPGEAKPADQATVNTDTAVNAELEQKPEATTAETTNTNQQPPSAPNGV